MAVNVKVTKASLTWDDPTTLYPYTLHMEGIDVDTLEPVSLEEVNTGATADVDTFITNSEANASWTVVN